jgi:hypothetical protein
MSNVPGSSHDAEVAQLREQVRELSEQVRELSARFSILERGATAELESSTGDQKSLDRRRFFGTTAAAAVAGVVGSQTLRSRPAAADGSSGVPLTSNMYFGATEIASPQPIDAPINWRRRQDANDPDPGYVRSVLALQSEGQGANSYPWTLFVKNTATTSDAATQSSANSYGINTRLINAGGGHGAAFFSDLQHGSAQNSTSAGESLGYDCEISRTSPNGRVIGLNVANVGDLANLAGTARDADSAVNIQSTHVGTQRRGWKAGILLEHVTPNPPSDMTAPAGDRGIWMKGKFQIGLDMENNDIKLNRGAKIFFDENRTLYLWLNPANTHLEFVYLNKVLGYLTLGTSEHII